MDFGIAVPTRMKMKDKPRFTPSVMSIIFFVLFSTLVQRDVFVSAAPKAGVACDMKAGFHINSVVPMWEEEIASIGCYSRNTSGRTAQEVHMLHLREMEGWPPPLVVTLHIKPMLEQSVHSGPLVLVLHSEFSVSWRLIADHLSNDTRHRIIVTKGSQVIESRGLQVSIQRKDIGRLKHLLAWTTKRFKALTSYAKIEGANKIILKVGGAASDNTAPNKCDFKSRAKLPNVITFIQEPIPINQRRGCVTQPMKARAVHVIKIHEIGDWDGSDAPIKVSVHLGSRARELVTKDVALVLQTFQPVEWTLVSDGVAGRVDVVTEGQVKTPRADASQIINVRTEALTNSTEELLMYTRDWFGPAFTYTEVWRANGIRVFVDDESLQETLPEVAPAKTRHTDKQAGAHRPRAIGNKDVVKEHLREGHSTRAGSETHLLVKAGAPVNAADIIRLPNVMLLDAMVVECLPQNIRVSFSRLTLEQLGLRPEDISLGDAHCSASVNESHYVLSSPFDFCGTKREADEDKVVYKNAVRFHFHVHKLGTAPSASIGGAPIDDEDGDNGSGNGAFVAPSTEPQGEGSLGFQCEYATMGLPISEDVIPTPPPTKVGTTLTAARELFKVELFRDPSFVRSVTEEEYPFTAFEHDTLYVETRLELEAGFQVVTEECWLSTMMEKDALSVAHLLRNTCPSAPTVQIESPADPVSNRFSFQLTSDYIDYPQLFLHCKLGICTSDKATSTRRGLKMCIDQRDFCQTESLRSYLELPRGTHHATFTKGPFQVNKRSADGSRNPFAAAVPFRNKGKMDLEVIGGPGETIDVRCTVPERQSVIILGLSTEAVIGIAFASFIIGVGLSAMLWCIYLRTDPLRSIHRHHPTHNSGYDLSGHSGSSTPSSQSPMTA